MVIEMEAKAKIRLENLFLNLATEEIFPNIRRDTAHLSFLNGDREYAISCIDNLLEDIEYRTADPKVLAAKTIRSKLAAFDQAKYSSKPRMERQRDLREMVEFYTGEFSIIMEGVDFCGTPMKIKEYVRELLHRTYDREGVPTSLNQIK